jgi:ATP-dependent DNA helicase DinG
MTCEDSTELPSGVASAAERAVIRVTGTMIGSEDRPGQRQMARAVATAIDTHRHLIVAAPTGVGKSLGYLVPAILSGETVVVTTATKALQDQLATKDLPLLKATLGEEFDFAVLKGRSNYLCLQRLREIHTGDQAQTELEGLGPTTRVEIKRLSEWAATTTTGDAAELSWSPSDRAWQSVSVSSDECPGAKRCPMGDSCWAEGARQLAAAAQVIVVNTYLYGLNVASGGVILPDHDVVVIDEAHQLEDIMSDTVGVSISAGRFTRCAQIGRRVLDDPTVTGALIDAGVAMREVLGRSSGKRLPRPLPAELVETLHNGRRRLDDLLAALRTIKTDVPDAEQRVLRAQQIATKLIEHIDIALSFGETYVPFVEGTAENASLEIAPLDVGPVLEAGIWSKRTAILTSATIPVSLAHRAGIPEATVTELTVDSPFDYATHGLLYCALHLPDPRHADYQQLMHDELEALINAAGGRTLALFTSWKAMEAAAEALKPRLAMPVLTQRDLPKMALVDAFSKDESSCLFATSGFFQGVDIPGRTLSLVTIDRIPFPRPDDPLLSARREVLGPAAFGEIDLPRATMLLAQAAGRLIRSRSDKGVVAIFDKRLGTANYRWNIVNGLPPMKRTRSRAEAEAFLRAITSAGETPRQSG